MTSTSMVPHTDILDICSNCAVALPFQSWSHAEPVWALRPDRKCAWLHTEYTLLVAVPLPPMLLRSMLPRYTPLGE